MNVKIYSDFLTVKWMDAWMGISPFLPFACISPIIYSVTLYWVPLFEGPFPISMAVDRLTPASQTETSVIYTSALVNSVLRRLERRVQRSINVWFTVTNSSLTRTVTLLHFPVFCYSNRISNTFYCLSLSLSAEPPQATTKIRWPKHPATNQNIYTGQS